MLDASDVPGSTSSGASTTVATSSAPDTASHAGPTQSQPASKSSSNGAAIGGGVAGGIIGAALICFALWWFCVRRKQNDNDSFNHGPAAAPAAWVAPLQPEPINRAGTTSPHQVQPMGQPMSNQEWNPATMMAGGSGPHSDSSARRSSALPDSDVDRIAARVASMIGTPGATHSPPSASSPAGNMELPPPSYDEKH